MVRKLRMLFHTGFMLLAIVGMAGSVGLARAQGMAGFDAELGATTYRYSCDGCHGEEGTGNGVSVPPFAGHLPNIFEKEGGRDYLINAVLYGLFAKVTVLGQDYWSMMPAQAESLSDEEIAAALNHGLTSWGNDEMLPEGVSPISVEEVATARETQKSFQEILLLRMALGLEGSE